MKILIGQSIKNSEVNSNSSDDLTKEFYLFGRNFSTLQLDPFSGGLSSASKALHVSFAWENIIGGRVFATFIAVLLLLLKLSPSDSLATNIRLGTVRCLCGMFGYLFGAWYLSYL